MKTKAAILYKQNSPLIIDDIEIPNLRCGQVLVKVHCSGICGAQIGEITGAKGEDRYLPHLLGHEGGGVVLKVGEGVRYVKKGDHVVMHWRKGDGIDASFPVYIWKNQLNESQTVGGGCITTLNEQAIISENRLTAIPKDIPFEVAALMGCAGTTALGLINNEAKLKIGQSIAVTGCGGVGLNVIQGAAMVAANPIIAIDIRQDKLDIAKSLGATHTINSSLDLYKDVLSFVKGKGVDVFVECTGIIKLIEEGYRATAPNGKMILVGQPHHKYDLTFPLMRQHYCGKTLMDSQGGLTNPSVDIPRYLELYKMNKLKFDNLITHYYPLLKINTAIDVMKQGKAGRCMIMM